MTRMRAAALAVTTALLLAACAPAGASERIEPTALPVYPQLTTDPGIPVVENIPYVPGGGPLQQLDLCLPPADGGEGARGSAGEGDTGARGDAGARGVEGVPPTSAQPRPVVLLIHGGSWRRGDKADISWRAMCQRFARNGFIAASLNYRLAPANAFPDPMLDVQAAVRWIRDAARVQRYNVDPARIGLFGASAGGNLAALVGTAGEGDWGTGSRVAAVVDLSGPVDLTGPMDAAPLTDADILEFLGCPAFTDCPAASAASPAGQIDPSDPPFLVAHSTNEFIPISQSDDFVAALREAGVDTTYLTLEGTLHAAAMLDDAMLQRILSFLEQKLGPAPVAVPTP